MFCQTGHRLPFCCSNDLTWSCDCSFRCNILLSDHCCCGLSAYYWFLNNRKCWSPMSKSRCWRVACLTLWRHCIPGRRIDRGVVQLLWVCPAGRVGRGIVPELLAKQGADGVAIDVIQACHPWMYASHSDGCRWSSLTDASQTLTRLPATDLPDSAGFVSLLTDSWRATADALGRYSCQIG